MKRCIRIFTTLLLALPWIMLSATTRADEVSVAVAANFTAPMQEIARAFEQSSGHHVQLSFGSTGTLYAQISNGAPFEVFLAADAKTPAKLVSDKLALPGSKFTYATGKLVLWSSNSDKVDNQGKVLLNNANRLAIANPKTAPYGAAAVQVLKKMGLYENLKDKLVQGNNIAQTFQFVNSGNVDLGFIALSQVYRDGKITSGSAWLIPQPDYSIIQQDAVLLNKGEHNAAAKALLTFIKSHEAKAIIQRYGYQVL